MSFFLQPVCDVNRETLNLELSNSLLSQTLDFCFISVLIYPHHRYFSAWCYIRTVTVVLPNSPTKLQLNESPVKVRVYHLTLAYAYCRCPLCMQFFFFQFFFFFFFLSFFPLFFLPLLSVITHHTITKKLFHNVCWACCFIRYVTILVFFLLRSGYGFMLYRVLLFIFEIESAGRVRKRRKGWFVTGRANLCPNFSVNSLLLTCVFCSAAFVF